MAEVLWIHERVHAQSAVQDGDEGQWSGMSKDRVALRLGKLALILLNMDDRFRASPLLRRLLRSAPSLRRTCGARNYERRRRLVPSLYGR